MAYTDIDEVREYAGIESTIDDTLIIEIISAAQQAIDTYTGRTFEASADTTRYYDAVIDTEGMTLYFDDADISSITTVTNGDSVVVASNEYTTLPRNNTPYYAIKILSSAGKSWDFVTDPEGAISVAGKWAYSETAPLDIQHACRELAAFYYRRREMPVADVTVIEAGVVTTTPAIPVSVERLLNPYRRLT